MTNLYKRLRILSMVAAVLLVVFGYAYSQNNYEAKKFSQSRENNITTADHSKFEILQQEFKDPREVTKACLSCHSEAAKQVHKTIHWTWACPKSKDKKLGKKTVVNNFCMSLPSNEPRCTSCHVGYGWKDDTFDFSSEESVDCLVCHDQTDTYEKFPTKAGFPVTDTTVFKANGKTYLPPNYSNIAQNVGKPRRENCGTCHYFGGGGNKVKHGDLDEMMNNCDESMDVHMAVDGLNFSCVSCHHTENHQISGRCYSTPAIENAEFNLLTVDKKRLQCESCHSLTPHKNQKINDHIDKVACQTCHIPVMAKGNPTKMWWDWSKAGERDEKGKPVMRHAKLEDGTEVDEYFGKKGEFKWAKNVEPEYFWYNGSMSSRTIESKIDNPDTIVSINKINGNYADSNAKIMPFKVHRGKQPYDKVNKTFVTPKLFGKKGTGAYWAEYDWQKAIKAGMDYSGNDYSGEYDWIETEMFWLVSHMVSPKEDALQCEDCHQPENSRLKNLKGFYMPGRDQNATIDFFGVLFLILAFVGTLAHGLIRVFSSKRRK